MRYNGNKMKDKVKNPNVEMFVFYITTWLTAVSAFESLFSRAYN